MTQCSPAGRISSPWHAAFPVVILLVIAQTQVCQAQRNSGAAGITLTAVLSQSLRMSVAPITPNSAFSGLFSDGPLTGQTALNISTQWVRGQGQVSVAVFAAGNPLLGAAGQALVPVEVSAPSAAPFPQAGYGLLSSLKVPQSTGLPEYRFNTSDLQIPAGSEAGMLTIRAEVL